MAWFPCGSDVGFAVPSFGAFVDFELRSDKQTGFGTSTAQQIVAADALAIAAFRKSLPPIRATSV